MIIEFLKIAFALGNLDNYPYWNHKTVNSIEIATTPTLDASYSTLENEYKISFEELSDDNSAQPLMIGDYLTQFKTTTTAPNNPHYNIIK